MDSRISHARFAEQVERYEDMAESMKNYVESLSANPDACTLTPDERNLLSVAYKNVVGSRRQAWRVLNSLEGKGSDGPNPECIKDYKKQIEEELYKCCNEVLSLIDILINGVENNKEHVEATVFYYKMKGDYYRYLAEVQNLNVGGADDESKSDAKGKAEKAYKKAVEAATPTCTSTDVPEGGLPATHPIRLGLALNFSVFYYEIQRDQSKACDLAKMAFDDAIANIDAVEEASYKDSTLIMQLLRDNLTLWTANDDSENDGDKDN